MKIPQLLFYVKRSLNKNVVIYKYNKTKDGKIDTANPIHHYWIMRENKGEIEELSFLEKKLAYGYTITDFTPSTIDFLIKPIPYYPLQIVQYKSSYITKIKIKGEWHPLVSVFVQLQKGFLKQVEYIDVFVKEDETVRKIRLNIY